MANEIHNGLMSLHTRAIDARRGYEEAVTQAEGKGLTPLFRQMIATHSENAGELEALLKARGEQPDAEGSFMGSVHTAIMDIRGLFGGLGESVLPGLIDGEQRNVARYDEVLRLPGVPAGLREALDAQRRRIEAAIATMQADRSV